MPYRWETFPIQPVGGLVQNIPALRLGIENPGAATRLVNFEPSINGGYRRINGYSKFSETAVTGTGQIFGVAYFDGDVIAVRNGNIYSGSGGAWTSIASGRTHTTKHRYHIINLDGTRKLIGVDGSNYPYSWDGTTFTNINGTTDILGASHVVEFKDHVFYAAGSLVTFSEPFDETGFVVADGAGSFQIKNDVTGMIVFRDRLFIFTENTIDVLGGSSQTDFALTSVAEDFGCIEPDTIQEVGGDVAFLSNDGIRLLGATDRDGDFSNQVASRPIQSTFNVFEDEYTRFSSCVVRGKSQYRIFGYNSGGLRESTRGFIGTQFESQNPQSFNWSEILGMKVYAADSQVYNGDEYIVFVSGDDYVYLMESGSSFDGEAITSQYWTPYISFQDPMFRKTLYNLRAYYDPEANITGTLTVNYDFNNTSKIQPSTRTFELSGGGAVYGTAIYGTDTYAGENNDATLEDNLIGNCSTAQFRFDYSGGAPFIIDSIFVEYAIEDRN